MIPIFPEFKKIELDDFDDLENFTSNFAPYNDFEFASLWTYDTQSLNEISTLNSNLVIKIQDFITGKLFYSFLGNKKVSDTTETLISLSVQENLGSQLKLVPEVNILSDPNLNKFFLITEDLDSFEYILSVKELSQLKGGKYYDKRNLVNRFIKNYPNHEVKQLDIEDKNVQTQIIELFNKWAEQKSKESSETIIELAAIKRLFDLTKVLKIVGIGVYVENDLIGFSTFHVLKNNYAIMTFEKGDFRYEGIYAYLNHLAARYLDEQNCIYINFEQDLGIPSLRKAKTLWRPVFFLKKYTVEKLTEQK